MLSCSIQPIAKNALIILINISDDREVLQSLASDDTFLESILVRITVCQSSALIVTSLYDRVSSTAG